MKVFRSLTMASVEGEAWERIKPVLQGFAELLGKDIGVYDFREPIDERDWGFEHDNTIYICCYSRPKKGLPCKRISIPNVFGFCLWGDQKHALTPSGRGIPIRNNDSTVIAEIIGNVIFILFNLFYESYYEENKDRCIYDNEGIAFRNNMEIILQIIMEKYALLQEGQEELKLKGLRYLWARACEEPRENYVRICCCSLEAGINRAMAVIRGAENRAESVVHMIRQTDLQIPRLSEFLAELTTKSAELKKAFAEEFEKLCALPVDGVWVDKKNIQVFTSVNIEYEGYLYYIGQFQLVLWPLRIEEGCKKPCLRVFNMAGKVSNYVQVSIHEWEERHAYHPHLRGSDFCCDCPDKNLVREVLRSMYTYRYAAAVARVIQFLQTVDPTSWYLPIENWPKITSY